MHLTSILAQKSEKMCGLLFFLIYIDIYISMVKCLF
jgi:hypothetical protein